jgi:adenosyl cobinamide kinase/adenosyl cobinamide phosphate guanylyltransferase
VVLIDCLTLLITNLIYLPQTAHPEVQKEQKLNLAGLSEAAAILGWKKQQISTYMKRDVFPEPYQRLASGPVWLKEQIVEYQRRREGISSEAGSEDNPGVLPLSVTDRIEGAVMAEVRRLADIAHNSRALVILVSNEVGLGLVPVTPEGRLFRDLAGWANQVLAARADRALMLVSGMALDIKSLQCDPRSVID